MPLLKKIPFSRERGSLHRKLLDALVARKKAGQDHMRLNFEDFERIEQQVRAYVNLPVNEERKKREWEDEGKPNYHTIDVPYSYAELMTAHTFRVITMLGRQPVFQFGGRNEAGQNNEQHAESLLDYQLFNGENLVPLYLWLYDAEKYGIGILSRYWDDDVRMVTRLEEESTLINGAPVPGSARTVRREQEVVVYTGNRYWNIRPHDYIPDPRVPLGQVHRSEFVGWLDEFPINSLLRGEHNDDYFNIDVVKRLKPRGPRDRTETHITLPEIDTPELYSDGLSLGFFNGFVMFVELVPAQWGLGNSDMPEKWVFTVLEDQIIISAQPYGELHDSFPIYILSPELEGYYEFPRSPLHTAREFQSVMSWLMNSHFFNVRRVLNDQYVVNPLMIETSDLENPLAGGIIRTKPAAYLSKMDDIIKQLPVQDVTRQNVSDMGILLDMVRQLTGKTGDLMGASAPSSRRTAQEIRSTSNFSLSRLRASTEFLAYQGWNRLALNSLQASQQFFDAELELRILGSKGAREQTAVVTSESISGMFDYIPVSGDMPLDNFATASLWKEILLQGIRVPEFHQAFNIVEMMSHIAQLLGIRNIDKFRVQPRVLPDEAIADEVRRGNTVPITREARRGRPGTTGVEGAPRIAGLGPVA